jgi:hypothetical protein
MIPYIRCKLNNYKQCHEEYKEIVFANNYKEINKEYVEFTPPELAGELLWASGVNIY